MGLLLGLGAAQAQNSVLAEGDWHRVAVGTDGVYHLNRRFLEEHGIITAADSLNRVRVFGNGGGMLPQANDAPVADDLRDCSFGSAPRTIFCCSTGRAPTEPTTMSSRRFIGLRNTCTTPPTTTSSPAGSNPLLP